jgi:serine/threonine protein kinase
MSRVNDKDPISSRLWTAREQIIGRFEDAWQSGRRPALEDYLPAGAAGGRPLLVELVHVDLEYRLEGGEPARVEAYLERFPALAEDPAVVRELLAAEFDLRRPREPALTWDSYRQRFPQWAAHLEAGPETPQPREAGNPDPQSTISPPLPEAGGTGEWPSLPGYEILGELGRGGMGVVYKARQRLLKRVVAVKMILAGAHAGPQEVGRFRAEAELVARLQHPNIVQIYEVGRQDHLSYLALELVEGGSLAARLDGTPWPAGPAAALVETLARAMEYAHQRGVIHRDLKPANILLQTTEDTEHTEKKHKRENAGEMTVSSSVFSVSSVVPKITDFGLAKLLERGPEDAPRPAAGALTQTGAVLGTPSYMAPEQAAGKVREVGPAADVYALGAILYELVTGRPPFKGASALDTLAQVVSAEPVPPRRLQPNLARDLETICLTCLRKEPSGRYPSAAALAEDLRRFQATLPIRARPAGLRERTVKWVKRRPALAALVAVSVLAVVALLALGLVYHVRLQEERDAALRAQRATERARRAVKAEQELTARALRASRQRLALNYQAYGRACASAARLATADHPGDAAAARAEFQSLARWLRLAGDPAVKEVVRRLTGAMGRSPAFPPDPRLRQLALELAHACRQSWLKTIDREFPAIGRRVRTQLYTCACSATASLARSRGPAQAREFRREFWELYWGELAIVESRPVERAMIRFGHVLRAWHTGPPPAALRKCAEELRWACGIAPEAIKRKTGDRVPRTQRR